MILDTSFLIDLFRDRRTAFEKGVRLAERQITQRIPSPVISELSYGAALGDETERRNVENAIRTYRVVVQAEATARRSGELLATTDTVSAVTNELRDVDAMIAAVADVYDEPVLTDNVSDFEALGVDIETY